MKQGGAEPHNGLNVLNNNNDFGPAAVTGG
jgi:hypothetical protein